MIYLSGQTAYADVPDTTKKIIPYLSRHFKCFSGVKCYKNFPNFTLLCDICRKILFFEKFSETIAFLKIKGYSAFTGCSGAAVLNVCDIADIKTAS
jgi:hypothetical protein